MTELEKYLKEVKERCEAATEGPWEYDSPGQGEKLQLLCPAIPGYLLCEHDKKTYPENENGLQLGIYCDGKFIAHSRTDIPRLLEMIEYLLEFHNPPAGHGDEQILGQLDQIAKGEVR